MASPTLDELDTIEADFASCPNCGGSIERVDCDQCGGEGGGNDG